MFVLLLERQREREIKKERDRETNRQTKCVPVLGLYACECVYKRTEVVGGQWKGLKEGGL